MRDLARRSLLNAAKCFDLGLVTFSFALATIMVARSQRSMSLTQFLEMRVKLSNCAIFSVALILAHVLFTFCGLYKSRRLSSKLAEILDGLKATTLSTGALALLAFAFSVRMMTPLFFVWFWAVSFVSLSISRITLRLLLAGLRRRGHNLRNLVILGTNGRAIDFARKIDCDSSLGYRILGFVDGEWSRLEDFKRTDLRLVSDFGGLAEYLRNNVVDEVAIYLPFGSFYDHSSHVAELCERHGIAMRFDSDIFGLKTAHSRSAEFAGDQHVQIYTGVQGTWSLVAKRALDITVSFCLLAVLFPLLVVIAILIKLTSNSPVFFLQHRIGLNKRQFRIFKFRTMVPNAEQLIAKLEQLNEVSGPVFKMEKDPRITPIGRLLRRSSLDELPQLLNVLRGEMSLVGPRPLPVRDYQGFNEDWQRRRFSVRPGITCLWQVNGRSGISFEQWMKLDLQYMDEWSLWLDLKILARTVPAVLKGSGAA
jgi:exopolysaccharide biosynthesis polyprenyl glycosylphosphotransferase